MKYRVDAAALGWVVLGDNGRPAERERKVRGDTVDGDPKDAQVKRYLNLGAISKVQEEAASTAKANEAA